MDIRNLCSKIDVDAIRAKLPPLPEALSQIKMPKSMSKLKSRKIFRSSREDMTADAQRSDSKRSSKSKMDSHITTPMDPSFNMPSSSDFVVHTPQRISTISSLVDQRGASRRDEGFYRSAGGIEDYCPSPPQRRGSKKPISPIRMPNLSPHRRAMSEETGKLSFVERMQKGYRDVSEFRLKHIFVRKTVLRKDDIQMDHYIQRFEEDRIKQQRYEEKMERKIADNYRFNFKTSRRKSEESFGIPSPDDSSSKNKRHLSEQSGDESGMEQSPPARKAGIAATRFARVRKDPLRMSLDEDDGIADDSLEHEETTPLSQKATMQSIRLQKSIEPEHSASPSPQKPMSLRKRPMESPKKRRAPLTPDQSLEEEEIQDYGTPPPPPAKSTKKPDDPPPTKPLGTIKENFRKFQKSFKLGSLSNLHSTADSEPDEGQSDANKAKQTKTQQFAERLKRFRSVDNVHRQTDDEQDKDAAAATESPIHKITSKLQEWKKSFRLKGSEPRKTHDDHDETETNSPPQRQQKPVGSLMRKLKHIRTRKHHSTDDPDDDEEGGVSYRESFKSRAKLQLEKGVAAASQMPQMTMEKLKETKKYFRKPESKGKEPKPSQQQQPKKRDSEESDLDEEEEEDAMEAVANSPLKPASKAKLCQKPSTQQHYYSSDDEAEEEEDDPVQKSPYDKRLQKKTSDTLSTDLEPYQSKVMVPVARASWTTKPIHSDSFDTGDDDEDEVLPRVLIHQDNSDVFESTLIIAVSRPMLPRAHSPSPKITELAPDSPKLSSPETKADSWVPNREIISGFLASGVAMQRELSKETLPSTGSRGHSRKHSMDSSSDDSWIKDVPRGPSIAVGLNSVEELGEPWKVVTDRHAEKLYKTKSIDIFEQTGGLRIFEDFDDELKNAPVVRIERQISNNESFEQEDSSEELDNADDDNSSRVTKILKQPQEKEEGQGQALLAAKEKDEQKQSEDMSRAKLRAHAYGNSAESLMDHLEARQLSEDEGKAKDEGSDEDQDRPPSGAPSPPPSISPPPPPLPARQPSIRLSKLQKPLQLSPVSRSPEISPPPLPRSRPPLPPPSRPPPPHIPERTPSMSRVAKPLVKTSSLRLSFDEQVNPEDVGKVNKLISRFEPRGGGRRPRLIARHSLVSSLSSEDEDDDNLAFSEAESEESQEQRKGNKIKPPVTPDDITPTNKPRKQWEEVPLTPTNGNNDILQTYTSLDGRDEKKENVIATNKTKDKLENIVMVREEVPCLPSIAIHSISPPGDLNSNFSQSGSEYGSPMAYPSSRVNSNEPTPQTQRKETSANLQTHRSRRSMPRDDERYFSFDSDEENSYYSMSSTSSRYVIDL